MYTKLYFEPIIENSMYQDFFCWDLVSCKYFRKAIGFGMLHAISLSTRSGYIMATIHATEPPQSWATRVHFSYPRNSKTHKVVTTYMTQSWFLQESQA